MKTLKKALALVLALALCLSLATVAFAANYDSYADASEVTDDYAEAVDVVVGLGIITGKDGNKLDLSGTLTRAEAAKILAVLDLGTKLAASVNSSTASTGFSDTQGNWASGYIAYNVSKGYLAGSNGKFSPNDELTGTAFGKMLLNAYGMGLTNKIVDGTETIVNSYEGSNWAINVIVDGNSINLFDGVKSDLNGTITRAEAMQMVFNLLKENYSKSNASGLPTEFYIKKDATVTTALGAAARQWYVGDSNTADTAVSDKYESDTVVKTYTSAVTYKALATDLGEKTDISDIVTYENGKKASNSTLDVDSTSNVITNGTTLTVYKSATGTYTFIKVTEALAQATAITKNAEDATKVDVKFNVSGTANAVTLSKVDAGTYTKDAYYVVVKNADANDSFVSIAPATSTTQGKVTGTGTGYYNIGGTKTNTSNTLWAIDTVDYNTTTFTFFLNSNGYVIGQKTYSVEDTAVKYDGYLYLVKAQAKVVGATGNMLGSTAYSATAKGEVYLVGSSASQVIDLATYAAKDDTGAVTGTYIGADDNGIDISAADGSGDVANVAGWYAYVKSGDSYVLYALEGGADDVTIEANKAAAVSGKLADASTVVNVYSIDTVGDKTTATVTTYTGIANFPKTSVTFDADGTFTMDNTTNVTNVVIVNYDSANANLIKSVDVYTGSYTAATNTNYAYYVGAGEYYAVGAQYQGFYIGGQYVEYKVAAAATNTNKLAGHAIVTLSLNSKGEITDVADVANSSNSGTVSYIGSTYITLDGATTTPVYFADNYVVYNATENGNGAADTLASGDTITYVTVDSKIVAAYITAEAAE